MNRFAAFAIAAVVASPLYGAGDADPLAPARSGALQCYKPDTAKKTCIALASYTFGAGDEILNQAEVLIMPSPLVVMKSVSSVTLKNGAVCGLLRKEDLDASTITVAGQVLAGDQAAGAHAQLEQALTSEIGKEICTTYTPQGDTIATSVTVDGVASPAQSSTILWVQPGDGYSVAP